MSSRPAETPSTSSAAHPDHHRGPQMSKGTAGAHVPESTASEATSGAARTGTVTEKVTYRVAPNPFAFLLTGALIGAAAGILVALMGPGSAFYTTGSVLGFFLVLGIILGGALGAIIGLIMERISIKRARNVTAEVDYVQGGRDAA